jgi:hypothetical protein
MTDQKPDPANNAPLDGGSGEPAKPAFTKEPQPDLPLEQRKEKAGWNRNRFGIWIVVGGFGLYMIGQGIVGILTKAR